MHSSSVKYLFIYFCCPSSTLCSLFSQFDFEMSFVCKVALDVYIGPAAALNSPKIKLVTGFDYFYNYTVYFSIRKVND
jgi:hypothetical protein